MWLDFRKVGGRIKGDSGSEVMTAERLENQRAWRSLPVEEQIRIYDMLDAAKKNPPPTETVAFNGRLRDECLNVEVFFALADVRDKLERWRQDYNQVRPHSSLGDHPPEVFARQWATTAAPRPEKHPDGRKKAALCDLPESPG